MYGRANDPRMSHMGMGKRTKWVMVFPAEDRNQTKAWQGERLPLVQAHFVAFLRLRQNVRQKQLKEGLQLEGRVWWQRNAAARTQDSHIVSKVGKKREVGWFGAPILPSPFCPSVRSPKCCPHTQWVFLLSQAFLVSPSEVHLQVSPRWFQI